MSISMCDVAVPVLLRFLRNPDQRLDWAQVLTDQKKIQHRRADPLAPRAGYAGAGESGTDRVGQCLGKQRSVNQFVNEHHGFARTLSVKAPSPGTNSSRPSNHNWGAALATVFPVGHER